MSSCSNMCPENSGAMLQAVSEAATSTTALSSDQQDITLQPDQAIIDHPQPVPSTSLVSPTLGREPFEPENQTRRVTRSTTTRFGLELKSALSITSLKSTIVTYSHGRKQWLHDGRVYTKDQIKDSLGAAKRPRPRIHSVIPSGTQAQRHPAEPLVGPSNIQIRSEPAGQESSPDVLPPSGGNNLSLRDSVVSPLTKSLPSALGRFQRSIEAKIPRPYPQTYRHFRTTSKTSTSSTELQVSNASSTCSTQSSTTSAGTEHASTDSMTTEQPTTNSDTQQLVVAVEGSDASPVSFARSGDTDTDSRHYEPSAPPPRRYHHHPSIEHDWEFRPTCRVPPANLYRDLTKRSQLSKQSSHRNGLAPRSSMSSINQMLSASISKLVVDTPTDSNPTLGGVGSKLQGQFNSFAEGSSPNILSDDNTQQPDSKMDDDSLRGKNDTKHTSLAGQPLHSSEVSITHERQDSAQENLPTMTGDISPSPPLPRRSSKRRSLPYPEKSRLSYSRKEHMASRLTRSCSEGTKKAFATTIPEHMREIDDLAPPPVRTTLIVTDRGITPDVAEDILLNILQNLSHLNDLFATATVNSGFYRVFKRHELDLIRFTLWKMSPPAWEYRHVAFPGHDFLHDEDLEMTRPQEEYTPSTYLQFQARDASTIRAIKSLIQERCQSFLRPEILVALLSPDSSDAARVDDALWRIWTFCKLFGSGKGREEDIVAQMDWLRGGLLAHQPACTFSITITDYMNDTLASAPEHFAKGNEGGLTAEQLFDMMELWNCLGVLLQDFEGHTAQAREFGIYDNTDIRGGDVDGEDMMLDEWCYYLLTFGLSTVLDLAGPHLLPNSSAFIVASWNGWTTWKPPVAGSTRRNFLKEAASQVYEDRIAHVYAESSSREVQRQVSKARIQKYITELQQRKNSGERLPVVRMSQERPMSEWDTVISGLNRSRSTMTAGNDLVSYIPSLRSAASNITLPQSLSTNIAELPAASTPPPSSPLRRTIAQPLLPTPPSSTVPSIRDRSSISTILTPINEHPVQGGYQDIQSLPSGSNHSASRTNDILILPQRHLRNGGDMPAFPQPTRGESSLAAFWQQHTGNNTNVPVFSQPLPHDNSNTPMAVFSHPNIQTESNLPPYTQPHACPSCNLPVLSRQHNCNRSIFSHPYAQNHINTGFVSGSSTQGIPGSAEQAAFQQHQVRENIYHSENHIDSAGKAIYRIVEMGFSVEQAQEALRITDMGDGLRVDRAVELLLRRAM